MERLTHHPGSPRLDPAARIPAGGERVRAEGRAQEHSQRNRYRVDQAYRAYETRGADPLAANGLGPQYSARNLKSAALLSSMIHQMGGGVRSSAKGVFVDISI